LQMVTGGLVRWLWVMSRLSLKLNGSLLVVTVNPTRYISRVEPESHTELNPAHLHDQFNSHLQHPIQLQTTHLSVSPSLGLHLKSQASLHTHSSRTPQQSLNPHGSFKTSYGLEREITHPSPNPFPSCVRLVTKALLKPPAHPVIKTMPRSGYDVSGFGSWVSQQRPGPEVIVREGSARSGDSGEDSGGGKGKGQRVIVCSPLQLPPHPISMSSLLGRSRWGLLRDAVRIELTIPLWDTRRRNRRVRR
jgi:hypothetical protein